MVMFKRLLLSFLAVILLIEEWLWNALTTFGRKLTEWFHLQHIENWLRSATPYKALAAFFVPVLIVTPINLMGLRYLAKGLIAKGLLYELVAKLLGTVLIARVFALTKPQLLTFGWFNSLYHFITKWLRWAHERVQKTAVYQNAKKLKVAVKHYLSTIKIQFKQIFQIKD
jgi:hypothetical protein